MKPKITPEIGLWYEEKESGVSFKVVAIEESDETIEVQYFNGDIGEFEQDSWYNSKIEIIEAPEDWSAPFGGIDADDLGYSDPDTHHPDNSDMPLKDYQD